jgi:hypothetical protein
MHLINKKIARLTVFFASILCASCLYAQTWTAAIGGQQNPCQAKTQCQCPQGYSYGKATAGNCSINGSSGCWNPSVNGTGACYSCGQGGTVAVGQLACFDSGYSNSPGSQNNSPTGVSCSSNSQCTGSGTYSGG